MFCKHEDKENGKVNCVIRLSVIHVRHGQVVVFLTLQSCVCHLFHANPHLLHLWASNACVGVQMGVSPFGFFGRVGEGAGGPIICSMRAKRSLQIDTGIQAPMQTKRSLRSLILR